ncbi:MAG: hypothetical protein ABIO70_04740 [Pseudomonadota bacterium]
MSPVTLPLATSLLLVMACTPRGDDTHPDADTDTDTDADTDTDTDADADTDTDADADTDTGPAPDYAATGPWAVAQGGGSFDAGGGCTMAYDTWTPEDAPEAPLVLLSHGFSRSRAMQANVAAHWASWGFVVVTPDLCHNSMWDSDPPADAEALVALVDALGVAQVIYAGHSAGGERSVLAAAADPRSVAVLGHDLVDSDDYALTAAPGLGVPLFDIVGEPGDCNSDGNGLPVVRAAANHGLLRVTEADHCDFEDPTEPGCTFLCGGTNDQFTDDELRATIRALSTASLLWQSGLDARGSQYWTPGQPAHDALVATGAVSTP